VRTSNPTEAKYIWTYFLTHIIRPMILVYNKCVSGFRDASVSMGVSGYKSE
jgi:hypothetical protein